ncbi:unnamed protein product [Sphagnum troendelagicum]
MCVRHGRASATPAPKTESSLKLPASGTWIVAGATCHVSNRANKQIVQLYEDRLRMYVRGSPSSSRSSSSSSSPSFSSKFMMYRSSRLHIDHCCLHSPSTSTNSTAATAAAAVMVAKATQLAAAASLHPLY